jgi:transposase
MKSYAARPATKILDDRKRGSQPALAVLFGVSRTYLEQLSRRRRTTREIAPQRRAGGRQPRCDSAALAWVRQLVREQPNATLEERCAQLQYQQGLRLSVASMCSVLQRPGLPRNKSSFMPPNTTHRWLNRPVSPTNTARPRSISGA